MMPLPPSTTLFPYTTLFRSLSGAQAAAALAAAGAALAVRGPPAVWQGRLARWTRGRALGWLVGAPLTAGGPRTDRKSTRLNSSYVSISYAVFSLKKT